VPFRAWCSPRATITPFARNDGKTFQRDFKVITGVDGEVEVLAH
jgi:hypothetical protein